MGNKKKTKKENDKITNNSTRKSTKNSTRKKITSKKKSVGISKHPKHSNKKQKNNIQKKLDKIVDEKIRRKIGKGLIITIVAIIILIASLTLLGIKINFILGNEIQVGLTPVESYYNIDSNQSVKVIFAIENNNFVQCGSQCNYNLVDLETNNIIDSGDSYLSHAEILEKSFTIPAKYEANKLSVYQFQVACHNIKSLFCLTDETDKDNSALVFVETEFNEVEEEQNQLIKENILNMFNLYHTNKDRYNYNYNLIDKFNKKSNELNKIYMSIGVINEEFNIINETINKLIISWKESQLDELKNYDLNKLNINAKSTKTILENQTSEINSLIQTRLDTLNQFNQIINNQMVLSNSANYFSQHKPQLFEKLNLTITDLFLQSFKLNSEDFSELQVNNKISIDNSVLSSLIEDYQNSMNEMLFVGTFYQAQLTKLKNSNYSYGNSFFDCNALVSLRQNIIEHNNNAVALKASSYNNSILSDVNNILEEELEDMGRETLIEMRDYYLANPRDDDNKIVSLIEIELSKKIIPMRTLSIVNTTNTTTLNISSTDVDKMTELDLILLNTTINNNCLFVNVSFDLLTNFNHLFSKIKLNLENATLVESNLTSTNISLSLDQEELTLPEQENRCCIFNNCNYYQEESIIIEENNYPVLFIHGHSFNEQNTPEYSTASFAKIQMKMQDDNYLNAGELDFTKYFDDLTFAQWGKCSVPSTVRATYYYIPHFTLGNYKVSAQKSERIENYALRLREIVDLIQHKTNSPKVNVVAHSMGGLVAREYINLFGSDELNKIILINTPNHGVEGKVKQYCSLIGASKECDDLSAGSVFLDRLNSRAYPTDANLHVIRSTGCMMDDVNGDGIVTEESAYLEGAKNYLIEGECTDTFQTDLHTNVLDPELYPQTYDLIIEILNEN